jgi:hypothetical protein
VHTSANSALTFPIPRSKNCRNPRACFICPNTGWLGAHCSTLLSLLDATKTNGNDSTGLAARESRPGLHLPLAFSSVPG